MNRLTSRIGCAVYLVPVRIGASRTHPQYQPLRDIRQGRFGRDIPPDLAGYPGSLTHPLRLPGNESEPISRARDTASASVENMGIDHCGTDVLVHRGRAIDQKEGMR